MKFSMEWYKIFENIMNNLVATIALVVLTAIGAFFRKVPRLYLEKRRHQRVLKVLRAGHSVGKLLGEITKKSGAIYVHIIRYHNGGHVLKQGSKTCMTVEFEKVGEICKECISGCANGTKPKPLQAQWQNITLTNKWFEIASNTVELNGRINTVDISEIDEQNKEVWKTYGITKFKEVFIKVKAKEFYTLGVSFCPKYAEKETSDGTLLINVRQLKNLL